MLKTQKPNKGGRPRADTEALTLRVSRRLLEQIDTWRASQRPIPTRPEAVRHYMEMGIKAEPILEDFLEFLLVLKSKPEYDGSLNKQIEDIYAALQKTASE